MNFLQQIQQGEKRPIVLDDVTVHQDAVTQYIDITTLCESRKKHFNDWRRTEKADHLMEKVAKLTGLGEHELVIVTPNSPHQRRTTWVHPKVAAIVATWLDPTFVIFWIDKLQENVPRTLTTNTIEETERHVSVLNDMIGTLERLKALDDCDRIEFRDSIQNLRRQICTTANSASLPLITDHTHKENCSLLDDSVRCLALAVALRLGHESTSFENYVKRRISAHIHHDRFANRVVDHICTIEPWQVALLLRAQSFRCLECDCRLTLTTAMTEDLSSFSLGRIWNNLPHVFPNICIVCRKHNHGTRELKAIQNMINNEKTIEEFAELLQIENANLGYVRNRNLVVEVLSPELPIEEADHMQWVCRWIEQHEMSHDERLLSAFQSLDRAGLGPSKRALLEELGKERLARFKKQRKCAS